jgi:hypothetical protein
MFTVRFEELGHMKPERARHQYVRDRLDAGVVDPHGAVVEAPRVLEMILYLNQLRLQVENACISSSMRALSANAGEASLRARNSVTAVSVAFS